MKTARCLRLIVISLALPLAAWGVSIVLMSVQASSHGLNLSRGAATFRDRCGACHFLEQGVSTHHGPNLYAIGVTAGKRKPNLSAAEYLLESIVDPDAFVAPQNRHGMPRNVAHDLEPSTIRDVVAFLASQGAQPNYEEIRRLEIPDFSTQRDPRVIRRDEMELAEHALREKADCLHCHSLYRNAEYQVLAPCLFGMGLTDAKHIRESIVDPNSVVSPAYAQVRAQLDDGRIEVGRLISSNDEGISLLTRGTVGGWSFVQVPASELIQDDEEPSIAPFSGSAMPNGFDKLLSDRELEAIVKLIRQLN
ncbi:MAG: c-type cytochrome [Planctomycetales bacterium]|nr:c-type cytochrome [Planctomycetales bacterium]